MYLYFDINRLSWPSPPTLLSFWSQMAPFFFSFSVPNLETVQGHLQVKYLASVFESDFNWDYFMFSNSNVKLTLLEALNNDGPRRTGLCLNEAGNELLEKFHRSCFCICPILILSCTYLDGWCWVNLPFKFTTMNLIDDTPTEFGLLLMRPFLVTNIHVSHLGPLFK